MANNTANETQGENSGSSGKKTIFYIIGAIVAVALVIGIIYLVVTNSGDKPKTELHGSYDSKVNLIDPNAQGKFINSAFVQH